MKTLNRLREFDKRIADDIQAEIDRYYLSRPLFEDGEPVQFGDVFYVGKYETDDLLMKAEIMKYGENDIDIMGIDSQGEIMTVGINYGERLKRPPKEVSA